MSTIILDLGSGNTCKNDKMYIKHMIDSVNDIDHSKHEVVLKWQLFENAGRNTPLTPNSFGFAYEYAAGLGYKSTASVFSLKSLKYLLNATCDIPFVKIANRRDLDWLCGKVPREVPVIVSRGINETITCKGEYATLCCCSKYPAHIQEYSKFPEHELKKGISDHTTDFTLWETYRPDIIEWHFCLEHDSSNPDGGLFARTPKMLEKIL